MAVVQRDVANLKELQRTQADDLATAIAERLHDLLPGEGENRRLTMRDFWIALAFTGVGFLLGFGDKVTHAIQAVVP